MQAKTKRRFKRALIALSVVSVIAMGVVVYLVQRPPLAWRLAQQVLDQSSPEMRQEIATRVKDRLAELSQSQSPAFREIDPYGKLNTLIDPEKIADVPLDEFVEMTLTNTELVALVNEMFVEWTNQRGYIIPGGVNDPVVLARDGRLHVTFMILTPYWEQVFAGEVDLAFSPDGMATGRVENLYAGSLPVSLLSIGQLLRMQMPASEHDTADRLGEWLGKLEHFEFRPTLELKHRRRARVLAMQVGDEEVTLRLRVQDHQTYRSHNLLLGLGEMAVTDVLKDPLPSAGASPTGLADVPTTTD